MAFEEGERRRRQPQQSQSRIWEEKQKNISLPNKFKPQVSTTAANHAKKRKANHKFIEETVKCIRGKKFIAKSQQKAKSKNVKDEAQIELDQLMAQGAYEMHNYESDFDKLFKENIIQYAECEDKEKSKKKQANRQMFDKTYLHTRESMHRNGKLALTEEEQRTGEFIMQQQSLSDIKGSTNTIQAKLSQLDITTHLLDHASSFSEDALDKIENLLKTLNNLNSIKDINNILISDSRTNHNHMGNLNRQSANFNEIIPKHKIIGLTQPLKDVLPLVLKKDTDFADITQEQALKLALTKALGKFNIQHPEQPIEESNEQLMAQQNQVIQKEKLALVSTYLQNNNDFSMRKTLLQQYKAPASKVYTLQQFTQQKTLQNNEPNAELSSNIEKDKCVQPIIESTDVANPTTTSLVFGLAATQKLSNLPVSQTNQNNTCQDESHNATNRTAATAADNIQSSEQINAKAQLSFILPPTDKQIPELTPPTPELLNKSIKNNNIISHFPNNPLIKSAQYPSNQSPSLTQEATASFNNFQFQSQLASSAFQAISNTNNPNKYPISSTSSILQQQNIQKQLSQQLQNHQQMQLIPSVLQSPQPKQIAEQIQSPSFLQKPSPIRPQTLLQTNQASMQLSKFLNCSPQPQSSKQPQEQTPKKPVQTSISSPHQQIIAQFAQKQIKSPTTLLPTRVSPIFTQLAQTNQQINLNHSNQLQTDTSQKLALQQLLQISHNKNDFSNSTLNNTQTSTNKGNNSIPSAFSPLMQSTTEQQVLLLQALLQQQILNSQPPQNQQKVSQQGFQKQSHVSVKNGDQIKANNINNANQRDNHIGDQRDKNLQDNSDQFINQHNLLNSNLGYFQENNNQIISPNIKEGKTYHQYVLPSASQEVHKTTEDQTNGISNIKQNQNQSSISYQKPSFDILKLDVKNNSIQQPIQIKQQLSSPEAQQQQQQQQYQLPNEFRSSRDLSLSSNNLQLTRNNKNSHQNGGQYQNDEEQQPLNNQHEHIQPEEQQQEGEDADNNVLHPERMLTEENIDNQQQSSSNFRLSFEDKLHSPKKHNSKSSQKQDNQPWNQQSGCDEDHLSFKEAAEEFSRDKQIQKNNEKKSKKQQTNKNLEGNSIHQSTRFQRLDLEMDQEEDETD